MTWNEEVDVGTILANECPANTTVSGHGSGAVDRLNLAERTGVVGPWVSRSRIIRIERSCGKMVKWRSPRCGPDVQSRVLVKVPDDEWALVSGGER
jgi:hypothetical protein